MTFENEIPNAPSPSNAEGSKNWSENGNEVDRERLLNLVKMDLDVIKKELFHDTLSKFQELSTLEQLESVSKRSFIAVCDSKNENVSEGPYHSFVDQVEYIRSFLQALKLLPADIVSNTAMNLTKHCETLIKTILKEYLNIAICEDKRRRENFIQNVILPVIQLMNDCFEINELAIKNVEVIFADRTVIRDNLKSHLKTSSSTFSEICAFTISHEGIFLDRKHFLQALALCQKLAKFIGNVRNALNKFGFQHNKLDCIDNLESELCSNMFNIMDSENGRSFIKFWCEFMSSSDERRIPKCLSNLKCMNEVVPELYMMFTVYMEETWFWKTQVGKDITPILIRSIRQDLLSTDKSKAGTKKRAAFMLKGITTIYTLKNPLFDPEIPEVAHVSLNNMNLKMYARFWTYFFELFDILDETQAHIVQPILRKLDIFQEYSDNESVFIWLPVLLTKMVKHDNRAIVKEGLERFLQTGKYFQSQVSDTYRSISEEFLNRYILPLLKDHVGWVLKDPVEFFKNVKAFGTFLNQIYSNCEFPHFKGTEKVMSFLTSSGKCMSSHAVFFFLSAVQETLNQIEDSSFMAKKMSASISVVESCLTLIALLFSTNMATVSKYFREHLENISINIVLKVTAYIPQTFPPIELESIAFLKFLTYLGSLSVKVLSHPAAQGKVQDVTEMYMMKGGKIMEKLTCGSNMYDFAKQTLSSTSVVGLFRFLSPTHQQSKSLQKAVEAYVERCLSSELLTGSIQGIQEIYENYHPETVPEFYGSMRDTILGKLETATLSSVEFMFCMRYLEIMSVLPKSWASPEMKLVNLNFDDGDPAKLFVLRKLLLIDSNLEQSKMLNVQDFYKFTQVNCSVFEDVNDQYFEITERNTLAEYYRLQFILYTHVVNHRADLNGEIQLRILNGVLDTMEKCDPKGVAAGLSLAKAVMKFAREDQDQYLDVVRCLQDIASLGWRAAFELRKNEAFWNLMEAFVEFLNDPIFVKSGDLDEYSSLIYEHGETIWGLPYVFVERLVQVNFPLRVMEDVNHLLVKAILAGAPLPKNHRMSFSLWDHLRDGEDNLVDDPENFSSDCKARVLACEKLCMNISSLISDEETKSKGEEFLQKIVEFLVERNEVESITRKLYFGGSATHRLKQRIFQCLLLLQPYFNYEISEFVLNKTLSCLLIDSPQPSVRYLGEWLVTLIVERYPELHNVLFDSLNEFIQTRIGFGAFFATICLHLSKLLPSIEFYDKALQSLAILTLSQHVTVRVYSQVAFQRIYERAIEHKFGTLVEKYVTVLKALKNALMHVSGNCSKLLENISQDFYVNIFDCKSHYCPEVIFTLLPRLSGMIKDDCILQPETIRKLCPLLSELQKNKDIINELRSVYLDNEKSAWHLKTVVSGGRELGEEQPNEIATKSNKEVVEEGMNYQKKINPWKMLSMADEMDEYAQFSLKKRCVNEEGLIVVATLLESLPNLGGLCRTCEIFGAQKYVVNTLKVINEVQFQNLSVSAQNWVNILEVPTRDLATFLLTYSAKGYAILGVEQANESSSLTSFNFPKKAVLLLGNEKLGIPADLLHLVDNCIEIPQVGVIRSLNVHVTGALCIWKYATQHIL